MCVCGDSSIPMKRFSTERHYWMGRLSRKERLMMKRLRTVTMAGLLLAGISHAQSARPRVPSTAKPPVTASAAAGALIQQAGCLIASDFYRANPPAPLSPVRLYDLNPANGASSLPRLTGAPGLIGLAWGPGGALYGAGTFGSTSGFPPNQLYRIDAATGATTMLGPVGIPGIMDGDMATHPLTGEVYALSGMNPTRLMRFPGLTQNPQNATATIVGSLGVPPANVFSDFSGLAFDASGRLFVLGQSLGQTGPNARLIEINPLNAAVIGTPVTLSQRFHGIGGLEFAGGTLYYAEGEEPGPFNGSNPNNIYPLFEINPATGAVTSKGPTGIIGGVSSLVSCTPPPVRACVPPPPDMVAWYTMDGNANDRVLGLHATAPGTAPTYTGGKVGQAVSFAGNPGSYLSIPPGPLLNQGFGDFSIDAWVVVVDLNAPMQTIADKRAGTATGGTLGYVFFVEQGRLGLQLADGGHTLYFDNRTLTLGWRHIAVTIDRDNPQGVVFYVDGQPGVPLDPTGRQGNLDNPAPTLIGRHVNGPLSKWVRLDELEFFDRVLRPGEVLNLWMADKYGKCK
jgi:hypothetical protein